MTELFDVTDAWPSLLTTLAIFGVAPGLVLRTIVLLYPKGNPRRRELIAELYVVPRILRPLWVAEQIEVALFEGLRARWQCRRRGLGQRLYRLAAVGLLAGSVAMFAAGYGANRSGELWLLEGNADLLAATDGSIQIALTPSLEYGNSERGVARFYLFSDNASGYLELSQWRADSLDLSPRDPFDPSILRFGVLNPSVAKFTFTEAISSFAALSMIPLSISGVDIVLPGESQPITYLTATYFCSAAFLLVALGLLIDLRRWHIRRST